MCGNSFGQSFRITSFGESHGGAIGVVVDGCPAGMEIDKDFIQSELDRRRPGQSKISTPRKEFDELHILSGVFKGKSLGTPIAMMAFNKNVNSGDYDNLKDLYRPSHADFTYQKKYGIRDFRGGGRSSARETWGRVAAGAIAKKYLKEKGIEIFSYVEQVGDLKTDFDYSKVKMEDIEANIVRCPDQYVASKMIDLIEQVGKEGDSIGGVIVGVIKGVPVGLGEPVFDKLHADLGKAMLSINAVKGFEIGSGFSSSKMKGSEHNDEFFMKNVEVHTKTNNSGGVLGGISNGEDIYFRVAFKPVATISKKQNTVNMHGEEVVFEGEGRHDPCVLPRAVPIVDAMSALVIMDHFLRDAKSS